MELVLPVWDSEVHVNTIRLLLGGLYECRIKSFEDLYSTMYHFLLILTTTLISKISPLDFYPSNKT